jgi:hypothetical protein
MGATTARVLGPADGRLGFLGSIGDSIPGLVERFGLQFPGEPI